ncbi:MAG TPA: hypothetical protein VG986_17770 [Pseudolabrys sp.]|nr:hypothetical protein [Pseudolabrys sp.]
MSSSSLDYSISARGKPAGMPVEAFIKFFFDALPIKSVFGFREYTPLYGGRNFVEPELSDADIAWMYDNGIGYRIPLQNSIANRADYEDNKWFLEKYHRAGNSVILVKPEMAGWIRDDFPLFESEASVILQARTVEKAEELLNSFDVVVLHPELNDEKEELARLADKDRIRLFANAGCMYKCPTMECYASLSRLNKRIPGAQYKCAMHRDTEYLAERMQVTGMTEFDIDGLIGLGFSKFKRLRSKGKSGY